MVIEGKLHTKFDTQQVSDSFTKRAFVVDFQENPLYPQLISFELSQDRCGVIDRFNVGDNIEVAFNLRGREWTNPQGEKKYFNSLEAWRVNPVESTGAASASTATAGNGLPADNPDEELPF